MDMKMCVRCKITKPTLDFSKDSSKKDKLNCYCKSCDYQISSNWVKNNRERSNKYKNDYLKKSKSNDESFRLACNLRTRLWYALKRQLTNKNTKTEELLGISFKEFKEYIEFLMTPGMTWKTIDLDHVRPLSSFDLIDPKQLKEAAHYTNIQPLLKSENRKKSSRLHEHDLAVQRNNIYEYEYFKYYLNN